MKKTLAVLLAAGLGLGVAYANFCAKDIVPAATLLVPYAVVDASPTTGDPNPAGYTTLLTVTNVSAARQIIHVTVWNMMSDAVVDFSQILSGYDVWTINFRDLINADFNLFDTYVQKSATYPQGYLFQVAGSTGFFPGNTGVSPTSIDPWGPTVNRTQSTDPDWPDLPAAQDIGNGEYSPASDPAGSCPPHFPKLTGGLKDYYRDVVIRQTLRNVVRLPQLADATLACRSTLAVSDAGSWLATFSSLPYQFYVTVDVVGACTTYFPNQNAYWTTLVGGVPGFARNFNVLMGYVYYVNQTANFSEALPAVHLERDADWAAPAFWGFYDQYATAHGRQDGTEPLGSAYAVPYYNAGGITSELIVWKDFHEFVDTNADGVYDAIDACRRYTLYAWDEDEQYRTQQQQGGISPPPTAPGQINALPFETQRVPVTATNFPAIWGGRNGWLMLLFDSVNVVDPLQTRDTQAYVALKINFGTYSAAIEGALLANTHCFGRQNVPGQPERNLNAYSAATANGALVGFPLPTP
ncbi:MAG: hypothetical protein NZ869_04480 [Thermoanaerobaculum sp.]|nr:hypothetical protein [Thermoanaerobaculum sp.]MDW7966812.1 hypothetical protein [Thermoanaerobaculum sp.]